MQSSLDVLSRAAAAIVQDTAGDGHLTNKELPTKKWRRERRLRMSPMHISTSDRYSSTPSPESRYESTFLTDSSSEIPLDMSVSSKPRTPPPPYREPLPGSRFITKSELPSYQASIPRPSVITQAPKRDSSSSGSENGKSSTFGDSVSMIDPVIDEHFRRSLGADYMNLFTGTKSNARGCNSKATEIDGESVSAQQNILPEYSSNNGKTEGGDSIIPKTTITVVDPDQTGMSVDDHFAKALGATWKQLQSTDTNHIESIAGKKV